MYNYIFCRCRCINARLYIEREREERNSFIVYE